MMWSYISCTCGHFDTKVIQPGAACLLSFPFLVLLPFAHRLLTSFYYFSLVTKGVDWSSGRSSSSRDVRDGNANSGSIL